MSRAALIAAILLGISSLLCAEGQPDTFPIFKQEQAIRSAKGREILKFMNLSARPCDDFYEFACGNWATHRRALPEQPAITPHRLLEAKVDHDLRNLLSEPVTLEDGMTGRKVKDFYKSCLGAATNEQRHQLFISDFIKSNGGFPAVPGSNWLVHHHNYDWQQVVALLRYRYAMDILIGVEIDINHQNPNENSIYLTEPSTLIPKDLCSANGTRRMSINEPIYEAIEAEVANQLRKWLTLERVQSEKLAATIVSFEYELCSAMLAVNAHDTNATLDGGTGGAPLSNKYLRKTLIDFTHQFNDRIDFNQFVTTSFGTPIYKPVFMHSPHYFERLIQVVNQHDRTTVANYIMYRALSHLNFPLNDSPHKRPSHCLGTLKRYFPKILGDIYQRKYANTVDKREINTLFEHLKEILYRSLQRNGWMEEGTSRVAKSKLDEISLAFPNYERISANSLQITRDDYWHNLEKVMGEVQKQQLKRIFSAGLPRPADEVEAFETRIVYRPYHKRIDIGWGLLQAPYYQQLLPTAMRYALIGYKLAQTLASAFDDYGWTSDTLGLKNWDPNTASEFYQRAACFRHQISNYLHNEPDTFHNDTRIRQLIAASGGLNVAFNAYLDWLHYKNPNNDFALLSKETLPELNFTNTQLFFVVFAQMHCTTGRPETEKAHAMLFSPLQRHTSERYEVNGPLKNSFEFAREFRCPTGTEMNSAEKCIIY